MTRTGRAGRAAGAALAAIAVLAAASGCGSSSGSSAKVTVVASTDVWGDVVKQIAGDQAGKAVAITSIITDPDADPHSYQADPQNELALSKASLVVENGGGYDDFVGTMLDAAGSSPTVINAVTVSGHTAPAGGDLNEHVWYDFPTVQKVAAQVTDSLAKEDPAHATTYRANEKTFDAALVAMERTEAGIKSAYGGKGVGITEPVPVYMLDACGLVNKTPSAFSEAVEEGTDVSVGVLKDTEDLYSQHQVSLLAYNEQTSGAETEAVLKAAKDAGIPVVPVTETLPSGDSYLTWMQGNLAAIKAALQA